MKAVLYIEKKYWRKLLTWKDKILWEDLKKREVFSTFSFSSFASVKSKVREIHQMSRDLLRRAFGARNSHRNRRAAPSLLLMSTSTVSMSSHRTSKQNLRQTLHSRAHVLIVWTNSEESPLQLALVRRNLNLLPFLISIKTDNFAYEFCWTTVINGI